MVFQHVAKSSSFPFSGFAGTDCSFTSCGSWRVAGSDCVCASFASFFPIFSSSFFGSGAGSSGVFTSGIGAAATAVWSAGATLGVSSTSLMEGILCIGGDPGLRNVWFDIFGVSLNFTAAVLFSVVDAAPPSGLFTLLRLPRFFKQVIGVDLQEAQLHRQPLVVGHLVIEVALVGQVHRSE